MVATVLTIAGSDPSGGAGLQADLKTLHQHGAYGVAVPTLITVQNTQGVERVHVLAPELVREQLQSVLEDLQLSAAKTGALGSPGNVEAVAAIAAGTTFPWVVDPVWSASGGRPLSEGQLLPVMRTALFPHAAIVTPNAIEAAELSGVSVRSLREAREAAVRIADLGAGAVLVKGGHLEGAARGTDVLLIGGVIRELPPDQVIDASFHGTGCALSAAIAARLASGASMLEAVVGAKQWLGGALSHAFPVGRGDQPVNHFWPVEDKSR